MNYTQVTKHTLAEDSPQPFLPYLKPLRIATLNQGIRTKLLRLRADPIY